MKTIIIDIDERLNEYVRKKGLILGKLLENAILKEMEKEKQRQKSIDERIRDLQEKIQKLNEEIMKLEDMKLSMLLNEKRDDKNEQM